ncbi:prepilin peptidase-dependent protein [Brenneria roseae subsp. roseae]|uniref:prepilin peptidase-dependent protein n=1 Tax=Brenneria roseae TaxID=1509241 RepID=UPI000D605B5E|nr:prepilin peptidase-dependent protein [Brenneria roseae]PWC21159.1 prepilin peptidase-dependent protein [Brenneria roseae subsp. roseae]
MNIRNRQRRGFTLLEILVVLTIVALLAGGSMHAWIGYQQALRLEQSAQQLLDFFNRVQANAYWHNKTRTVRLIQQGERWCMVSDAEPQEENTACREENLLQYVRTTKEISVSKATSNSFAFYGLRSTAQAGHITLMNSAGKLRLIISVRGRMRLCSEEQPVLAIPLC